MGVPAALALAGAISFRPSLLRQAFVAPQLPGVCVLMFGVWMAASSLWSPAASLETALICGLIALAGVLFVTAAGAQARLGLAAAQAGALVLIALLAVEALFDLPLNRMGDADVPDWELALSPSRGASVLLGIVWAAGAGFLLRPTRLRITLGLATLAGGTAFAAQFDHSANTLAALAGLAVFAAAWAAPGFMLRFVTTALAAWLGLAPIATALIFADQRLIDTLPFSWAARVETWSYLSERIAEQPWIGHGLDAGRATRDMIDLRGVETRLVPTHPHSASLQIWFEAGVIGAALAAGALVLGGRALARATQGNRAAAAGVAATIAALGLVANVSYSLWQEWWLGSLFVAAAACAALVHAWREA